MSGRHNTDWSPLLVPGLLQTSDYARAILANGDLPAREVEPRVMMRMARRDVITRSRPAVFTGLIGEAALHNPIGGPEVTADQLRHVLKMTDSESVTVQVVPTDSGWHPGLSGPFILFDFADSPSIVHIEHHRSSVFLYDERDVEDYRAAAEIIRGVAMSPADSTELISEMITKLENAV